MKRRSIARLLVFSLLFLLAGILLTSVSSANTFATQPFSQGAYGDCVYSQGCNPPPPTTVVPVAPSENNPTTGRVFSVNITDGQQFDGTDYQVVVIPNFPVSQIEGVELFVGSQSVGTSNTSDNGNFIILWQLPGAGNHDVKVVMHLKDGGIITQQFHITVTGRMSDSANGSRESTVPNPDLVNPNSFEGKTSNYISQRFGSKIPNWLQNIISKTPRPLAYAIPYILLGLLGSLLLVFFYQIRNQLLYIAALIRLLKRDKELADDKANFIMLASHYIRTPLTILSGSIELALSDHAEDTTLQSAKSAVDSFHARAEQILKNVESNEDLRSITAPDIKAVSGRLYNSLALILPIVLSALLVVAINVIFIAAQRIHLVVPSVVVQIILFIILSVALYSIIKRRRQQADERRRLEQQRGYEEVLDRARNKFIEESAGALFPLASQLKSSFDQSSLLVSSPQIEASLGELSSLLRRFMLITELERGKIAQDLSDFKSDEPVRVVMAKYQTEITDKKLQIKQNLTSILLHQNKSLIEYVTQLIIDNAVKFTPASGRVTASTAANGHKGAKLVVRNYGASIDPKVLARLFQPFSRENAYIAEGGAGLGLYLARLIMRYLDGDVALDTETKNATTATVTMVRRLDA